MLKYMLSLALFTIPLYAQEVQHLDTVVAIVNDEVITQKELDAQTNLFQAQLGEKKLAQIPDEVLRKKVLDQLITKLLQLQVAKQNNLSIDNNELDEVVTQIAKRNKLTLSQLQAEIKKNQMNWDEFKDNLKKDIIINKIQQRAIGKEAFLTPAQIEAAVKTYEQEEKRQVLYHIKDFVFPLTNNAAADQVDKINTAAKKLINKLKSQPDNVEINYDVEENDLGERSLIDLPDLFSDKVSTMKIKQVIGPIRAPNGLHVIQLLDKRSLNSNQVKHEVTKTHVRHILIKAPTDEKIKKIHKAISTGTAFDKAAKQYSDDIISAERGGDLGWVNSGELAPEFENTMNSLAINQISQPIRSSFGWHIIEVLERKQINDEEEFKRQQIKQVLQQKKIMEAVQNWQNQLKTQAYIKILDKALV